MKKILAVLTIAGFLFALPSCKGKSDADLKTAVENALHSNPDLSGVSVEVKDATATLSGEVKDATTQSAAESTAKGVDGVKGVDNLTTVALPEPVAPVVVTADDSLQAAVADAVKDHPGVTVSVSEGVVTLNGDIAKDDLKILMQKVQATKPKRVDSKGLNVK
ncbi:BON domain-containing protein [Niabella insulamsoli]|uniref:BON domain-containing protein n=1 Tax=Niabella insulamsoli TaxID=3144874 RepID=UPI0031FCD805